MTQSDTSQVTPPSSPRVLPRRIAFLLYDYVEEQDFLGPWEMFGLWKLEANGPDQFTVAEHAIPIVCTHGLSVLPQYDFSTCPQFDVLVVPGGKGKNQALRNLSFMKFLKERGECCDHILSVCTGSLLLEGAGLLRGKRATTHWESLPILRECKGVTAVEGERYVQDGKVWTAAGIFSGNDMALAFINSFEQTETSQQGAAGKVQLYAEYFPSLPKYNPQLDLSGMPEFVRNYFGVM